jgi:uncharacterized membrane protein YcaP (DUF421 family)
MEIVIRVAVIYFLIMVGLRVLGKREFGQLTPFELVTLLLIPEMVSKALTGEDYSMTAAMIGVATLLTLVLVTSILAFRYPAAGRAMEGSPALLARHGAFLPDAMNRERVAPEEVGIELHKYGLEELSQVKWALLEVDGSITLVPVETARARREKDRKEMT